MFAGLAVIVAFAIPPICEAQHPCALTQRSEAFKAPVQSRLASLIIFARLNRISFGIETTSQLSQKIPITMPAGPVGLTIKAILGPTLHRRLECSDGLILIRDQTISEPTWLDKKVPEFRIPRGTFGLANAALFMRVKLVLNPKQTGFVGAILGDNPADQVGPF